MLSRDGIVMVLGELADDLEAQGLHGLCGFTSVEEALDQVQSIYPHQPVPPRAQYLLDELFPGAAGQA